MRFSGCLTTMFVVAHISLAWAADTPIDSSGAESSPNCTSDQSDSRCQWLQSGAVSLNTDIAANWEVIRLFGGVALRRNLNFMAEFRREPNGGVWLSIRDLDEPGRGILESTTESVWRDALQMVMQLERDYARRARAIADIEHAGNGENSTVVVCADGAGVQMDTALEGKIFHLEASDCQHPEVDSFLDDMRAKIYSLVPYCSSIPQDAQDLCTALDGDKFQAAAFVSQISLLGDRKCEAGKLSARSQSLLSSRLAVDVLGEKLDHAKSAAEKVFELYCQHRYSFRPKIISAQGNEISVAGTAEEYRDVPLGGNRYRGEYYTAFFSQRWSREEDGRFRVYEWKVGKFVKTEWR